MTIRGKGKEVCACCKAPATTQYKIQFYTCDKHHEKDIYFKVGHENAGKRRKLK